MRVHVGKKVQEANTKVFVFNVEKSTKDLCLLQFDKITDSIDELLSSDDGLSLTKKGFYIFDNKVWKSVILDCVDTMNQVFIFSDKDISDKAVLLIE